MYTPSVGMDELGKRYTRLTLRYGYKSIERVLSTSELYELWTRSNPYSLGRGLLLKASPALFVLNDRKHETRKLVQFDIHMSFRQALPRV
jgi:hypothetical protein